MTDRNPEAVKEDRGLQADPELASSEGRAGAGQIFVTAVAAVAIVVATLYGLTHQRPETSATAATPPSQGNRSPQQASQGQNPAGKSPWETTGAAPSQATGPGAGEPATPGISDQNGPQKK